MINRRLLAILALVLSGCTPAAVQPAVQPAVKPVTLHAGDGGTVSLPAGTYLVAWQAPSCSFLEVSWAPTSGGETVIVRTGFDGHPDPSKLPAGEATVSLPAGPAYVNRGGDCPDYVVTITPAAAPS